MSQDLRFATQGYSDRSFYLGKKVILTSGTDPKLFGRLTAQTPINRSEMDSPWKNTSELCCEVSPESKNSQRKRGEIFEHQLWADYFSYRNKCILSQKLHLYRIPFINGITLFFPNYGLQL